MSTEEYAYLKEYSSKTLANFNPNEIDTKKLDDLMVNDGVYDHIFQENLTKILNSMDSRIFKNWVRKIKIIGEPSANGIAMEASTESDNKLFILKVAKKNDQRSVNEMIHECFIGIYALNNIRQYVPNFTWTYGMLSCTKPILRGKEIISWCVPTKNENYLILENIRGATPLSKFINTCTTSEYLQVFLQILNALTFAHKHYGFTHSDLHDANILVRKLKHKIAIPCYNGGYIITDLIAFVIDYGQSFVYYKGKPEGYGKYKGDKKSDYISSLEPNPAIDSHKMLMFTATTAAVNKRDDLFIFMEELYKYFGTEFSLYERLVKRANDMSDYFGIDPKTVPFYSHEDFFRYITESIKLDFISRTNMNYKVASCTNECNVNINSIKMKPTVKCPHHDKLKEIKNYKITDHDSIIILYEKIYNFANEYTLYNCKGLESRNVSEMIENSLIFLDNYLGGKPEYEKELFPYFEYLTIFLGQIKNLNL